MTDPRALVEAYVEEHRSGEYGDRVDVEAPGLVAALRAVLDLHGKRDDGYCRTCSWSNVVLPTPVVILIRWPCNTVQAITTALETT